MSSSTTVSVFRRLVLQQTRAVTSSAAIQAPLAETTDAPRKRFLMGTHPHLDNSQPPLGSWPNFEPGVNRPTQVNAPEPSLELKEQGVQLVLDASDATEIEEYDRVHSPTNQKTTGINE